MVKIALIDNSINHDFYNPIEHWKPYLEALKVKFEVFRALESDFPNFNDNFTHIILTGSGSTILECSEWILKEIKVVREAVTKGIAILGSCFGHQLIARAISGIEVVRRAEEPEIGWIEIKIKNSSGIFRGIDNKIFAFNSHFDEVFNLPKEYKVLAFSSNCSVQAFQYLEKPIWGIQFHPEINIYQARVFLKKGEVYLSEHTHLFKKALDSNPKDSEITSIILKNFIFFS